MKHTLLILAAFLLILPTADAQKNTSKQTKHKKTSSKPTYYYNSDGTLSDKPQKTQTPDSKRPSAYKGDDVPANDGQKKNQQRNMNYNSGQPLPSSSGK